METKKYGKVVNITKKRGTLMDTENKLEVTSWEKQRGRGYTGIRDFKKGLLWD